MSKAYVINLDKCTDRWEKIQKTWNGVFEVERISAVEASPGWIGCYLSHVKAIEEAKARGDPYVLVWEDDCIPKSGRNPKVIKALWDEVLPNFIKHKEKWDIVIGGSTAIYQAEPTLDTDLSTNTVKVFRLPRGATTHWTFYNSSVYDKIIEWKNTARTRTIDEYMYDCTRVFITAPFMAEQSECYSFIQGHITNYSANFEKTEKYLLSKQK
jgi:GR25 family glycosyltransferase involved in LPS biosynthesis